MDQVKSWQNNYRIYARVSYTCIKWAVVAITFFFFVWAAIADSSTNCTIPIIKPICDYGIDYFDRQIPLWGLTIVLFLIFFILTIFEWQFNQQRINPKRPVVLKKAYSHRETKSKDQFALALAYDWFGEKKFSDLTSSNFRSIKENLTLTTLPLFRDFVNANFKQDLHFVFQQYDGSAYEPVLMPELPGFFRVSTFFAITDANWNKLVIQPRPQFTADSEPRNSLDPDPAYIRTSTNETPYDVIGSITFTAGKLFSPFLMEITKRPIIAIHPIPGCAIEFVNITDRKSKHIDVEYCVMLGVAIVVENLPPLGQINDDLIIVDPRIAIKNTERYTSKAKLAIKFLNNAQFRLNLQAGKKSEDEQCNH